MANRSECIIMSLYLYVECMYADVFPSVCRHSLFNSDIHQLECGSGRESGEEGSTEMGSCVTPLPDCQHVNTVRLVCIRFPLFSYTSLFVGVRGCPEV